MSLPGDDLEPPGELGTGHVESLQENGSSSWDGIKAVLWLPDPEQRHGWREFYIRDAPAKPGGKIGF